MIDTGAATAHAWPSALREALEQIEVGPNATWVRIGERLIEDDDPGTVYRLLGEVIYSGWHAGRPHDSDKPMPKRIREPQLEALLSARTPQQYFRTPVRICSPVSERADGTTRVLVNRDNVKIWVELEHIEGPIGEPGTTATMLASATRPALSPGFFFAHGSASRLRTAELLRVYIHITDVEFAPDIWACALELLETRAVSYRAKIISSSRWYPRFDAMVVYLDPQRTHMAVELADLVAGRPGIGRETSVFAERLAPGVATAWEPRDPRPGMDGVSFGQHRAGVIANALLDSARGKGDFGELLLAECRAGGIDPRNFARNSTDSGLEAVAAR